MDPLFPELPEDLSDVENVTDEKLEALLKEHEVALEAINEGNEEFLKGVSPDEELSEMERGIEQIEAIKAEQKRRDDLAQEYVDRKNELAERAAQALAVEESEASEGGDEGDGGDGDGDEGGEGGEAGAESEVSEEGTEPLSTEAVDDGDEAVDEGEGKAEAEEEEKEEKEEAATASAVTPRPKRPPLRRPPAPSADRRGESTGAGLIAVAGQAGVRGGTMLDRMALAEAIKTVARSLGPQTKHEAGIEQRFLVASANFPFPEDRRLYPGDPDANARKIRAVVPAGIPGLMGMIASGGLCAPLENIYTLVNFASQARPVREALASFQADRGGVNVPESPTIGDITTAISLISEADDALGGTFATKSCQDLDCVDYVETAVSVISHCREYGNLNARAWPERIAHENDLTMAAWARTAERFLLDRIKEQSIEVTQAAVGTTMNAFASLVYAISAATAGVKRRLRMDDNAVFRTILPSWIGEILAADDALKQLDTADRARAALTAKLAQYAIRISYALDDVTGADTFAATQAAGALELFPSEVQYPLFPEGEFIHLDMGVLELGLVRDSTLNSTNDFQLFGESFENVARIGPAQAALWVTQDICPNGVYPALGTAPTCA